MAGPLSKELFDQGLNAWNQEADKLEEAGKNIARPSKEWDDWRKNAKADFCGVVFAEKADFANYRFPGPADFTRSQFPNGATFEHAEFSGEADFSRSGFGNDVRFARATFASSARFLDSTFKRDANFALAKFGGKATFAGSTFSGEANFASAQFTDEVSFCPLTSPRTGDRSQTEHRSAEPLQPTKFLDHATFEKTCFATLANFEGAQFAKSAAFGGAEFSGPADFDGTCFGWGASFWEVRFKGYGTFRRARFKYTPEMNPYPTQFLAAKCQGGFNLEEATFEEVPNFDQAHFEEGPRLDHIRIPHQSFLDSLKTPGDPERSARYRALKRLAAQGHDHDSEQRFFASELRSRRGNPDRPWPTFGRQETPVRTTDETPTHDVDGIWPGGASYWVGFFYDLFSNFGRSITRPIFLWLLTTSIAAAAYLGRHCLLGKPGCIDGQGSPLGSAVYLALRKGLIFPGLSPDQKLDEAYACLFGTKVPFTGSQHIPIIPNSVTYLGIGQTLFSGVLIFLFFLAIRNQFRIK